MPAGSPVWGAGHRKGYEEGFKRGQDDATPAALAAGAVGAALLIYGAKGARIGIKKLKERSAAKHMKKMTENGQLDAEADGDDAGVERDSGQD